MADIRMVESGRMGRVAYGRIAPNEDLVQSVEKLCLAQGFRNAFVRGALGSLVDACLAKSDGSCQVIRGPAAEIVSLAGEVRSQPDGSLQAALTGSRRRHQRSCLRRPVRRRGEPRLRDVRSDARRVASRNRILIPITDC